MPVPKPQIFEMGEDARETSVQASMPKNRKPGERAKQLIEIMEEFVSKGDGEELSNFIYEVQIEADDHPELDKQIDIDWYSQKADDLMNQKNLEWRSSCELTIKCLYTIMFLSVLKVYIIMI